MNTVQKSENDNSKNIEVEEVQPLQEDATDEQKKEYYEKLESNNKQLYARVKKAEGFIQDKDGKWVKPSIPPQRTETRPDDTTKKNTSELSTEDLYFLIKADVHKDDFEKVTKFAKFEGISVQEALNNQIVKGLLSESAESRKVADGTNVGGGKRGNAKVTDESLVEDANKGIFPENDADMKRLSVLMRKKK